MQIYQLTIIAERLETMRKAFGEKQTPAVCRGQDFAVPLQEGRRIAAQVHRHIPNCTAQTSHEFHLGIRGLLKMQAANRTLLLRERLIDLDDGFVPAGSGEFFGAVQAREETAAIAQLLALDDFKIGDGGIENGEAAYDDPLGSLAVS